MILEEAFAAFSVLRHGREECFVHVAKAREHSEKILYIIPKSSDIRTWSSRSTQ